MSQIPTGVTVEEIADRPGPALGAYRDDPLATVPKKLVITTRWRNKVVAQVLVFVSSFVVVVIVAGMSRHPASPTFLAEVSGFLLLAVGLSYWAWGSVRRRIVVTAEHIRVERLTPWSAELLVEVATAGIVQLFVQRRTIDLAYGRGGTLEVSDLIAMRSDGKREELLMEVTDYSRLRFIERRIEMWLGIENVPVPGERKVPR